MVAHLTLYRVCTLVALALACAACATHHRNMESEAAGAPADRRGYSANPSDFYGVYFKSGAPGRDEPLFSVLSDEVNEAQASLEHDLKLISTFPSDAIFRVVAFTDAEECNGEACVELSLRRAESIRNWLISRGVPEARLLPPYGYGSARPVGDNATSSGRALNRRAYISDQRAP